MPLTVTSPLPTQNLLLAALPLPVYDQLLPDLELIEMNLGHSLYESGGNQRYVYFPVEGIVSLLYVTQAGNSASDPCPTSEPSPGEGVCGERTIPLWRLRGVVEY